MLNERRARLSHDAATGDARVVVEDGSSAAEPAGAGKKKVVQLLLDARGRLVGVDLGGDGLHRQVVMIGRHEDVFATRDAEATLYLDASQAVCELRIAGGKSLAG